MKSKKLFVGALVMTLVFSSCGVKRKTFIALGTAAANAAAGAVAATYGAAIDDEQPAEPKREPEVKVEPKRPEKVVPPKKEEKPKVVKISFDSSVLFNVAKFDLKAAARDTLSKFAKDVQGVYQDYKISIHGFASSEGNYDSNMKLSERRAQAVHKYLTESCGVKESQIKETVGFGSDPKYLIYDANGKEDRVASRRVEIILNSTK